MRQNKYILILAFLIWSISAGAQDVRQLLKENPDRAANNMHSYEYISSKDTPAPKGYNPVYISHYGRHGSRHDVSSSTSEKTLAMFLKADSLNLLTSEGRQLMEEVRIMAEEHVDMGGQLSPRGGREHEQIALRMADRFPAIFGKGKSVSAVSSTSERCIVSMGYFMSSLKSRFPDLNFSMTTGDRYAPIIRLTSAKNQSELGGAIQPQREGGNRGNGGPGGGPGGGPQTKAPSGDFTTFFSRIFVNPAAVEDKNTFVNNVFKLGGLCQDLDFLGLDMYRFFTLDELVSLWEQDNDSLYERWGNSIEKGYAKALTAKPLVKDIVDKADEALKNGKTAADLRFGHDMSYMALLSLLGIDADGGERYKIAEAHNSWYGFQIVPTAANLQVIFYRKGDSVIFKMLRNEQEVAIPGLKPVSGPYYRWEDFKEKFTPSDKVGIEFDKDNFIILRNTIGTAKGPVEVVYKAYMHLPYVTKPLDIAHQSFHLRAHPHRGKTGRRIQLSHSFLEPGERLSSS